MLVYWEPRSVWAISPGVGRRNPFAISSASRTRSVRRCVASCQPRSVGVADARVLGAAVGVGDQPRRWSTQPVRHFERVEDQVGAQMRCELPADDRPAVAVEDEGEVDEAAPGPQVGDVGHPLLVRPARREVALQEVAGPLERCLVDDRCAPPLAAADAFEAFLAHQPGDMVAAHLDAAAAQLLPGLAHPVHGAVALTGGVELLHELAVGERTRGRLPGPARVVRAHRHANRTTDRLDPEDTPPLLHVAAHLRRVGSSSVAKYTDASFKIAFARRSSTTSLRRRFSSSRSSLVSRSRRRPLSASACRTHTRNASWWMPRSRATLLINAQRLLCSAAGFEAPRGPAVGRAYRSADLRTWNLLVCV